jgi:hypothetical protein
MQDAAALILNSLTEVANYRPNSLYTFDSDAVLAAVMVMRHVGPVETNLEEITHLVYCVYRGRLSAKGALLELFQGAY